MATIEIINLAPDLVGDIVLFFNEEGLVPDTDFVVLENAEWEPYGVRLVTPRAMQIGAGLMVLA